MLIIVMMMMMMMMMTMMMILGLGVPDNDDDNSDDDNDDDLGSRWAGSGLASAPGSPAAPAPVESPRHSDTELITVSRPRHAACHEACHAGTCGL